MVKTQYVDSDALTSYIENSGIKIGYLVDKLGISRQAFDKKRKGSIAFRAAEVYVICDILNIPEQEQPKIFCVESCE